MKIALFDIDNWKEIGSTLSRNKTRTFLTGFGIFWGVAMLALLMGGAKGGEGMLKRNFAGFATNSGGMIPSKTTIPYHGYQKGRAWGLDITDVEMLREACPELKEVIPTFQKWGVSFKNGKNTYAGQIIGAQPNYTAMLEPKLYAGRFINEADENGERRVAVVGKKVAARLYPGIEDPTGKIIEAAGAAYSIVGVVGDASEIHLNGSLDEAVVLPASTFRRANGYGNNVDFIMMVAKDDERLADIIPKMRRVLYRRHDIHPNDESALWVINIAENFEMVDNLFTGIDLVALFIGISTLLAGVIGIGNIMWVIVKERTQEIGIRRAIGAKPRDIIVQVLCEGVALTLVAGLAGLSFAALLLGIMQHVTNPPDAASVAQFQMSFSSAVAILLTFLILGILAGLIPSVKAMRIKPVEAINSK
ncbi:MAG: ABC transporter permease [Muribaculaceae bacterium]|nr:ABC transporter permease [Muribaculaceae bacterium]